MVAINYIRHMKVQFYKKQVVIIDISIYPFFINIYVLIKCALSALICDINYEFT